MKISRSALTLSALALATTLGLSACKKIEDGEGTSTAASATGADAPAVQVQGLKNNREQVGYAIGLDLGNSIKPLEDEIDLDAMVRGIRDNLAGKEPKLNDEQVMQVMQGLATRMQAKQAAEAQTRLDDEKKILDENAAKPNVQTTESGLQYEVLTPGTGPTPSAGDRVRVHYEGKLLDGTVFDSSIQRGEPVEFSLGEIIPGWQEGLQLMQQGAKHRLWIPSSLGYGEQGAGPIPPNAALQFEVELIEVLPASAQ
ncbi:FKBP-type peptidyl-prolyl cis-trans isomerase [Luteimonas yindakuii]|uniref:Peptidyl-prolyl cis-trans isomerase n=1 Tax=Luteimonas yindakuii TaxID=2565782 RepID=A0A4Z1RKG0_9GAMM|nr:FKBP-type peptidyl-prolyl cis-trans isomerase [Luteimonas yindakuii]QCO67774.1 FKBP-type peptidyl-prolyl cis-trans isomerase [Luteimonas yindakuii]TKS54081.1 FKBP-type peptidyl-prolyl cis-trans isomerase [Luteimonas yindakuii]